MPPGSSLPRTHAAEKAAQEALVQKRGERSRYYEEATADLRAYLQDRDEEQKAQAAAIKGRGEIREEAGQAELQTHMEAFHNRRLGDEVRANQALNGALRDYGEGLISAQQLNTIFEAAGAKMSGVQHYLRTQEQRNLGRKAEVKLGDFAPPRKGAARSENHEWATDAEGHPAAYNPKTGEWHRTETQEMANVLDDAFETMEEVDRNRLFGEAAKEAQISWGRRQELEGLLEEFPTYPGMGASSTERGHVVALAQVLRGMDATLRYAQQAEAEAEAPRLTVPFYSLVEKGLEGAPMEEQQMAFAWGAMLMLDYLSLGTMGLATGPMRAIEPGVEALAARSGGRAMGDATAETLIRRGKVPPKLYWHGSAEGVARRKAGGIFVDGPGNGGLYWVTARQMDKLGLTRLSIGGNTNVRLFPPGLVNKGGFQATYELTSAERALFRRAWGPRFNWNPWMWWKGGAGQFYYRQVPATWGQRLRELGGGIGITSALGSGYVYKKWKE